MNVRFILALLAGSIIVGSANTSIAQEKFSSPARTSPETAAAAETIAPDLLALLPASDVVIDINVRRILSEALPRVLAKSPAKLAQMNEGLNQLKAVSGVDARVIDRVVIGAAAPDLARVSGGGAQPGGAVVGEAVVIVQGRFDAEALIALGRIVTGDKLHRQEHAGRSFYTFAVRDHVAAAQQQRQAPAAILGQMTEAAVAIFDKHTLALGTPAGVRASLEARARGGNTHANAELIRLATINSQALIGIAMNTKPSANRPPTVTNSLQAARPKRQLDGIDLVGAPSAQSFAATADGGATTDEFKKIFESMEQIYFSLGMSAAAFNTLLVVRTQTVAQADHLNNMLAGFVQMIGSSSGQSKQPGAANLANSIRTTAENNEVRIRAELPVADVAAALVDKPSARTTTTAPRRARPRRRS